ncbi:MAG: hypothetical protein AAGK97_02355, partial [Bacteroidota bacterium]
MKSIKLLPSYLVLLLFTLVQLNAQENIPINVKATKVKLLGKSKPIRDLDPQQKSSAKYKRKYKRNKQKPDNFRNRRGVSKAIIPELEHQGPDPIRQFARRTPGRSIEPLVNVQGIGDFGSPHDPSGDVSSRFYVQAINVTFVGVFDEQGTLVQEFAMNTLWSEFGVQSAGDPIVLYDQFAKKWIITEFTDPANVLIAVSETGDPLGSYFAYNFSTPEFPDYPKYAIYPDHLVITTNEGGAGVLHNYFLDRNALINGEDNVNMQRVEVTGNTNTEAGFFVSTPVDWNGSLLPNDTRPITMALNDASWGAVAQDQLELYLFDIDFDDPNNTQIENVSLVTTPFDGFPCSAGGFGFACIPQLGGNGLDGIPEVVMNVPHYRNFGTHESIVLSFVTDVTDGENQSGIRWMEIRNTDNQGWEIYQEGTYAPDGKDRFMSSIAIDDNGNIGLGYNISSEEDYAGIRITGRLAGDPLGQMTFEEFNVADGQNTIQSGGRFGDYSQMSVTPDGRNFWFTTEYAAGGQSGVGTRIVAFKLQKDTFDIGISGLINPQNSSTLGSEETVSLAITNFGIETIDNYEVEMFLDGNSIESISINQAIQSDSVSIISFNNPVDLSEVEEYRLNFTVSTNRDDNISNNTFSRTIEKYFTLEAGIETSNRQIICESSILTETTVENIGENPIDSIWIEYTINGSAIDTVRFTGPIEFRASRTYNWRLRNLSEFRVYEIQTRIIKINEGIDTNLDDNLSLSTVERIDGADASLNII